MFHVFTFPAEGDPVANRLKLLKLKPQGFQFIQELPVDAPPSRVWEALLDVRGWWRFYEGHRPEITLEPWPGGRFFGESSENDVTAQSLHGTVTYIEPNKLLRIGGQMGLTHLPVMHALIWELEPRNDGRATLLRFAQRTFGFIDADVKKRYQSGWKILLPQLKAHAEGVSLVAQSSNGSRAKRRKSAKATA
jgi:uncharacterized protein YndB with AHSA1/START domain